MKRKTFERGEAVEWLSESSGWQSASYYERFDDGAWHWVIVDVDGFPAFRPVPSRRIRKRRVTK